MKRSFVTFGAMVVVLILMSTYLPAMAQQASTAAITVDEAKLGKDVKDRQIVDETADFALQDKVFLWVKVTGAAGETLKVTWKMEITPIPAIWQLPVLRGERGATRSWHWREIGL